MRRLGVVIIVVMLAGCAAKSNGPAEPSASANGPTTTSAQEVVAPMLPVGTAWTYRGSGIYNVAREFTIVVTPATDGYLFAASKESDLSGQIIWPRTWFGPHDASLNVRPDGTARGMKFFDFPLYEGKSWPIWADGPTATARAGPVPNANATEAGFTMRAAEGNVTWEWNYVPSVGFFTRYVQRDALPTFDLRLEKVETRQDWVWYERGAYASAKWDGTPQSRPQATLTVPSGLDAVVAIAYGESGSRGAIIPPDGPSGAWSFEGDGCCTAQDDWKPVFFPATPGDWQLAMAGQDAYGAIEAAAVKWVRGTTTS